MGAVWYCWRTGGRRTWRSMLAVALVCGVLGTGALGALAGARRTESAYGHYLRSINASDVTVNIPSPDTSLVHRVAFAVLAAPKRSGQPLVSVGCRNMSTSSGSSTWPAP
jgi:hypothetical protein